MASLRSRPSQSPSKLLVALVGEDGHPSLLENEESKFLAFLQAWKFLEPAVEKSGEHTKQSVWDALQRGQRQLWLSKKSAVITEMISYPSGLTVVNGWLAGGDLQEILRWLPMLEDWGRQRGATRVRVVARRGWAKVCGYREVRSIMIKELGATDA